MPFKKINLKFWAVLIAMLLCCPYFLHAKVIESDDPNLIYDDPNGINPSVSDPWTVRYTGDTADPRALLRDSSGNPSYWDGSFWSNYSVLFVNTNGITFGANANIQAANFIASTLNISNADFLSGNYKFFKNGESAFILSRGNIVVNGGYVALLSQAVENQGTIVANLSTVVLASGEEMTLALDDLNEISVVIDKGVQDEVLGFDSAIKNTGTISANGGKVILTAKVLNKVFDYAINNAGIIEAKSLVEHNGIVELVGEGAPIYNIGKIEAGSIHVITDYGFINIGKIISDGLADLPNGGRISIEAASILQQGLISANAAENGIAGEISIVSGTSTVLDEGSSTEARALGLAGNGGRITVNSTGGNTVVDKNATIDVSAGAIAGDAGFIEISAFDQLGFYGILNGRAPPGYSIGQALIDPAYTTLAGTFAINIIVYSEDNITIIGDITLEDGAILVILADHNSETIGDWHDNVGAILNSGSYTISGATNTGLILMAASGIGSASNPIKTAVLGLAAYNSTSGDIVINNTGDLVLFGIVNEAPAGQIDIRALSNLLIKYSIIGNGDINLAAENDVLLNYAADIVAPTTNTISITATNGEIALADLGTASGLAGYWNFDEGSGTTAGDSSGNGNDGEIFGSPVWGSGVLYFDGVNDYVLCDPINATNITLFARVNFDQFFSDSAGHAIISNGYYYSGKGYMVYQNTGSPYNALRGFVCTTDGDFINEGPGSLTPGQWYDLAMTYNGEYLTIYVNGGFYSQIPVTGDIEPTDSSYPLLIGSTYTASGAKFKGSIDEVRIYDQALSQFELFAQYLKATGGSGVIRGGNLMLSAAAGIGSDSPLQTVVSNLLAQNTGSTGNIKINNSGDLVIFGVSNSATGGTVEIDAASDISIRYSMIAHGNINLTATGSIYLGYLADIIALGHTITLTADGEIALKNLEAEDFGLLAYWKLDETSGTTAYDSSGNNYHGTVEGDPLWDTGGYFAGALNFDGNGDYVNIGLNFDFGCGPFTIIVWYKGAQSSNYIGLAGAVVPSGAPYGYTIENHNGHLRSWVNNNTDDSTATINDEFWHQLVMVRDGATGSLYIDGLGDNVGFATSGATVDTDYLFWIGGWGNTNYLTNGLIDDVRVYNRALSPLEIYALYNVPLGSGVIRGGTLITEAAEGIGSAEALRTEVSNLQAINTISGDININNIGNLTIFGSGVSNSGGDVEITTHSDLILVGGISTTGTVYLYINGAIIDNKGGYEDIVADKLELRIVHGMGDSSQSNDELETEVNYIAVYNSGTGLIDILNTGTLTVTTVGSTTGVVNDGGDIILRTRNSGSNLIIEKPIKALGNTITLDINGALIDNHYSVTAGNADIQADNLQLRMKNGNQTTTSPTNDPAVETTVHIIAVYNSSTGNILLENYGDLIIGTVGSTSGVHNAASSGNVSITTHSNLTLESSIIAAATVALYIDGYITDHYDGYEDVVAQNLEIRTVNGIFDDYHPENNELETMVDNLAVRNTGSGSINILNTGTLTVTQVNSTVGVINNAGDINLYTRGTDADLIIEDPIKAVGYSVLLAINGMIDDHSDGWDDVVAKNLEIRTVSGVRDTYHTNKYLETMVENLSAVNTTSGDINVRNTGDLNITIVGSTSGVTNTTTAGGAIDIKVKNGTLNVLQDVLMENTGDADATIILDADNAINIEDVSVQAIVNGAGNASITLIAGTTITIDGSTLTATSTVSGDATISISAPGNIGILNSSTLTAYTLSGDAYLSVTSSSGSVEIDDSVLSSVTGVGSADVAISGNSVKVHNGSSIAVTSSNKDVADDGAYISITADDGNIEIYESTLMATGPPAGTAQISLSATGSVLIDPTYITSTIASGLAKIDITAGDIDISDYSQIKAIVELSGEALVDMLANTGDIKITHSHIEALVGQDGDATVKFNAGNTIELWGSWVEANVGDGDNIYHDALVDFSAGNDIKINYYSTVLAKVVDSGEATVKFKARRDSGYYWGDISVYFSTVSAQVGNNGNSLVDFDAADNIYILNSTIQALGGNGTNDYNTSTIDFNAGNTIFIDPSTIQAIVYDDGKARIYFTAGNDITLLYSIVKAEVMGNGSARVYFNALGYNCWHGDITVDSFSLVLARVGGYGWTSVEFYAEDDIKVDDFSAVISKVGNSGCAMVFFWAGDDIRIDDFSTVKAEVGKYGYAGVTFRAYDDITVDDFSSVLALVGRSGRASIYFKACDNILIDDVSLVLARVFGYGCAKVRFSAGGDIKVDDYSRVVARVWNSGHAEVDMDAGDWIKVTDHSLVGAYSGGSSLSSIINMDADYIYIADSTVEAIVYGSGTATVNMNAYGSYGPFFIYYPGAITIVRSGVTAEVLGDGSATINLHTYGYSPFSGLYPAGYINILDDSTLLASIGSGIDTAEITLTSGNINILDNSTLWARTLDSILNGYASINLYAYGNYGPFFIHYPGVITIDNSSIAADVAGIGEAYVNLYTYNYTPFYSPIAGTINILNNSWIQTNIAGEIAGSPFSSGITIQSGDINIQNSTVWAMTTSPLLYGHAYVDMDAYGNFGPFFTYNPGTITVENSLVSPSVAGYGDANVDMHTWGWGFFSGYYDAGRIDILNSDVLATAGNEETENDNTASVTMTSGDIFIDPSHVEASATGLGDNSATVDLNAVDSINILGEYSPTPPSMTIQAIVNGDGDASVLMNAGSGINITDDTVLADVSGNGSATIYMDTPSSINITNGDIRARVDGGGLGNSAAVTMNAVGDITIDPTTILAFVINGTSDISLTSTGTIDIINTTVASHVRESGDATINMSSTSGDINITTTIPASASLVVAGYDDFSSLASTISAAVSLSGRDIVIDQVILGGVIRTVVGALSNGADATITIIATNIINAKGRIFANAYTTAYPTSGIGRVNMTADEDIFAGDVRAAGGGSYVVEKGVANLDPTVDAKYVYGGRINIVSNDGDVTLGNVIAEGGEVLVEATGGSIKDTGDVIADYLRLIAENDIGTSANPIRTNVLILTTYSTGTGDIYIFQNTTTRLELGLYLERYDSTPTLLDVTGRSVAANNGIIHILSNGDVVVNSVVAPHGGVLLMTLKSIYAGHGWCPAYTDALPATNVMTGWSAYGGPNGFYAVMPNLVSLPEGPNVIAGGYSLFAAPYETIGVGDPRNPALAPDAYNPLHVNIQIIPGSHSAFPFDFNPFVSGIQNPPASLSLLIGGVVPSLIYSDGFHGTIGISGALKGIVRPGVYANPGYLNPLFPVSPLIIVGIVVPSQIIDLGLPPLFMAPFLSIVVPPGYVFHDDSAQSCLPPLTGPGLGYPYIPARNTVESTAYIFPNQIWPPIPGLGSPSAYLLVLQWLPPVLERMLGATGVQLTPIDVLTSDILARSTFYYHPLTLTDMSAFAAFELGMDAYELFGDSLNLLGHEGLLPIFEEIEKKKKKPTP